MDGVFTIGVTGIPFRQEGMTRNGKDIALIHRHIDQPKHNGITKVRSHHDRAWISMHRTAKDLRGIRIIGQALRKRLCSKVERAPCGVGPSI